MLDHYSNTKKCLKVYISIEIKPEEEVELKISYSMQEVANNYRVGNFKHYICNQDQGKCQTLIQVPLQKSILDRKHNSLAGIKKKRLF